MTAPRADWWKVLARAGTVRRDRRLPRSAIVVTSMTVMACSAIVVTSMTVMACSAAALPVSAVAASRTTLPVIERQVMCVTCKIPLNVAESPQADRERALIRRLIAEGKGEAQVKSALVSQYGAAVLGLPASKGFDLAAYLVPVAVVLALMALLALLLPSWRRHARASAATIPAAPKLSESDAARLDADLKRFD